MRTKSRAFKSKTAIVAFMALIMAALAPASIASAEIGVDEGTLTIHKLSSEGVATEEDGKTYHPVDTLYYEYLAGAEYEIYKIGTFTQTSQNPIRLEYEAIAGLVDKVGNPVILNSDMSASNIDTSQLTPFKTVTTTGNGGVTVTLDADTVYLVKESKTPAGVNAANNFIITVPMYLEDEWNYEIDAYPKNTYSNAAIEKSIIVNREGSDEKVSSAAVNVGDIVTYQIDVDVPVDIESANYTKFVIKDTSSPYLEIDDQNVTVEVEGDDYTLISGSDYTVTYSNNVMTITFSDAGIAKLRNGDRLIVTYQAQVLPGAENIANGPVYNKVELDLEVDETEIPPVEPEKPEPKLEIYGYGIKKFGTDKQGTDTPLAGAVFVLAIKDTEGDFIYLTYNSTTAEWDEAGDDIEDATPFTTETGGTGIKSEAILQFMNLDPEETYYLIEKAAPSDYAKLPNPIEIKATEGTTKVVYRSYVLGAGDTYVYQNGVEGSIGYSMTIKNLAEDGMTGWLPSTGGFGTVVFWGIGILLIVTAGIMYAASRKKAKA